MKIFKNDEVISVEELREFVENGNFYSAFIVIETNEIKIVQGIRIIDITDTDVYWEIDDDEVMIFPKKYRDYEFIDADNESASIKIDGEYYDLPYDIVISY